MGQFALSQSVPRTEDPRLPGLGSELSGVGEGATVIVRVPAAQAHGLPDPARIRRVDRARFPADEDLTARCL